MKVGLNVFERVMITQIVPKEGNFITLRLVNDLVSKIGLSAQDFEDYGIVQEEGKTRWNEKGIIPKEFELADAESELIRKQLKKMDDENKLSMQMFTLYEKFCT